jgi:multidrug efflux pump subunit AcrA (membrane-fusion protein)
VTVNGDVSGIITQVSPAIDPQTGTIEVDVALTGDQSGLTDGDSVTVDLDRTASSLATANASSTASIIIPIVALKITPTGPEVFTVDPVKSVLLPHPVQIGSILGANIVITSGLTPDLMIVTDARGLVAGENVVVKKPQ